MTPFYDLGGVQIHVGHVLDVLAGLPAESCQVCVTSPPYWGLRAYGTDPQVWGGAPDCNHTLEAAPAGKVLTGGTGTASAKQVTNAGSQYGNAWMQDSAPPPNASARWGAPSDATGFRNGQAYTNDPLGALGQRGATCTRCGAWRGELGSEPIPDCLAWARGVEPCAVCFVCHLVVVFRAVRRVLHPTGTCWVNLGDSYSGSGKGPTGHNGIGDQGQRQGFVDQRSTVPGLGPKQLLMLPARCALALQADGWVLRRDVIWSKPNPMPESVDDRPTTAHEYLFLLAKRARYFYDADAVREANAPPFANRKSTIRLSDAKAPAERNDAGYSAAGRDYTAYNPAGRNRRSVWTIPTEAYSGAKSIADYVGRDGKPYKASPDCPIHGLLENLENPQTVGCDVPSDQSLPGSLDTSSDRGQAPACGLLSTDASPSDSGPSESESAHTPGNTGDHRMPSPSTYSADGPDDGDGSAPGTDHRLGRPTPLPDNSDSLLLPCAPIATDHSTQTHRTGLAPATSPAYTASAQIPDRTDGRLTLPGFADLVDHTAENNTSAGVSPNGFGYDPSAQKRSRTADICTCTIITQDHFATFPRKLVEPCILAGTSARGQCPRCGAPWIRQVQREATNHQSRQDRQIATGGAINGDVGKNFPDVQLTTTGWAPTCPCPPHEPIPQTVLDPFAGSGTSLYVARHHGRRAVGIELNAEYARLAADRLRQGTLGLELY